jgi:hypothetical protein
MLGYLVYRKTTIYKPFRLLFVEVDAFEQPPLIDFRMYLLLRIKATYGVDHFIINLLFNRAFL